MIYSIYKSLERVHPLIMREHHVVTFLRGIDTKHPARRANGWELQVARVHDIDSPFYSLLNHYEIKTCELILNKILKRCSNLYRNRTIWIAWLQGWDQASHLQNKYLEPWIHYNPEWNINIIDNRNIFDYIPEIKSDLPGLDTNPVDSADIYRTYLVKKYGWSMGRLYMFLQ